MILSVSLVVALVPFTLGMEWLNTRKIAAAKDLEQYTDETDAVREEDKAKSGEKSRNETTNSSHVDTVKP
jgi:hypothetical protein